MGSKVNKLECYFSDFFSADPTLSTSCHVIECLNNLPFFGSEVLTVITRHFDVKGHLKIKY